MGIKKSKEEIIFAKGTCEEVHKRIAVALHNGGFRNIKPNLQTNQVTATYKKLTVWGEVAINILPKNDGFNVCVKSTANVDNIFALFFSPTKKIIDQFKMNF